MRAGIHNQQGVIVSHSLATLRLSGCCAGARKGYEIAEIATDGPDGAQGRTCAAQKSALAPGCPDASVPAVSTVHISTRSEREEQDHVHTERGPRADSAACRASRSVPIDRHTLGYA